MIISASGEYSVPSSPFRLLLLLVALGLLIALVEVDLVAGAFEKLGLTPGMAYLLLFSTLVGSLVNLPLLKLRNDGLPTAMSAPELRRLVAFPSITKANETIVAVNLGGCVIPVGFSIYLLLHGAMAPRRAIAATAVVALVAYLMSRPIPGFGIAMPILVAPIAAAIIAAIIGDQDRAALAYISGSMGVLIGADLLHFQDIRKIGTGIASIGGAGTFDGIFMSGVLAVLLA